MSDQIKHPLTVPTLSCSTKQQFLWNQQYNEHDLLLTYSNRGGELDESQGYLSLGDVFHEIHARDDFGIVTIFISHNGQPAHIFVEQTNLGYNVRPYINNKALPSKIVKSTISVTHIFI